MPRPRFKKLAPAKQARILEVSAREFAVHGFGGASLNHILETAGISKGAAYYYFDDKADLFATVIDRYFLGFFEQFGSLMGDATAETFWGKLGEFYRQSLISYAEQPWMLGLMRAMWRLPRDPTAPGPFRDLLERGHLWIRDLLRKGRGLGVIRGDLPEDLLEAWFMALDLASDRWMADHLTTLDAATVEGLVALSIDTFRRLLDPPRAGGGWVLGPGGAAAQSPVSEEKRP